METEFDKYFYHIKIKNFNKKSSKAQFLQKNLKEISLFESFKYSIENVVFLFTFFNLRNCLNELVTLIKINKFFILINQNNAKNQ